MTMAPSHIEPFNVMLAALAVFTVLNLVLAVRLAVRALRGWRTYRAARALVDVHLGAMETNTGAAIQRSVGLERNGRRLSNAAREFSGSFRELRYLLRRVPEERVRLRNALLELILPTEPEPDRP